MIISAAILIVTGWLTLRTIGKEQPITKMSPLISIIIMVIFVAVSTFLIGQNTLDLLYLPSLLLGSVVGFLIGGSTEIYKKNNNIISKRKTSFLIFWISSIILNQGLFTLGFGQGLALTIFSSGILIGSEGKILFKITRIQTKSP